MNNPMLCLELLLLLILLLLLPRGVTLPDSVVPLWPPSELRLRAIEGSDWVLASGVVPPLAMLLRSDSSSERVRG